MGVVSSCTACVSDNKHELELRNSLNCSPPLLCTSSSIVLQPETFRHKGTKAEQSAAVTIQTYWKGYVVRKLIDRLVKTPRSGYFPRSDIVESLTKSPIATERETKNPRRYKSGAVYKGQWLGNFRDGLGTMTWPDGAEYAGSWQLGYPCGDGKFTAPDGEIYQGRWGNIYAQGQKSLCRTGEGWQDSVNDGFEWLWYKEEIKSTPSIETLKKAVKDALNQIKKRIESIRKELDDELVALDFPEIRQETTVYRGQTKDNQRHGFGQLVYDNGDTYFGYWDNDKQHGNGHNLWADGSEFVGVYNAEDKEGEGEYRWDDGTQYQGDWKANLMHGYGFYSWPDGRKYEGEWRFGLMQGFGVYWYSDGRRYEGGWFKGKKHGLGMTYGADGRFTKALWSAGKLTRA